MAESLVELKQKWSKITHERFDKVENILTSFGFICTSKGSSHFIYRHPRLTEAYSLFPQHFPKDFAPDGSLNIVRHHNKVAKCYLKIAFLAIETVIQMEQIKNSELP